MIDVRTLYENLEPVRASQRARGANPGLADEIIEADIARREALQAFETLQATQKEVPKSVGRALKEERPTALAQAKELAEQAKAIEAAANAADVEAGRLARLLPNLVLGGVPVGGEEDFVVLCHEGPAPRDFAAEGFEPQSHLTPNKDLDAINTKRDTKVSGARFYYLKDISTRFELAFMTMAMGQVLANGFILMTTPTLMTLQVMGGTGFFNEHPDEIYHPPADDLYLTGMFKMALIGHHVDGILGLSSGPRRYMDWSICYRRKAGSAGEGTRNIVRIYQFNKAEIFSCCRPEEATEEHQRFFAWEEEMLAKVELPYRVVDTTTDSLGTSAAHKFDCKVWLPTQECYMEVTSAPDCTTFQAYRLGIRERQEDDMAPVTTLSSTLTTTRWVVVFLENRQQADGSTYVSEALRSYLSGLEVLSLVARRTRSAP